MKYHICQSVRQKDRMCRSQKRWRLRYMYKWSLNDRINSIDKAITRGIQLVFWRMTSNEEKVAIVLSWCVYHHLQKKTNQLARFYLQNWRRITHPFSVSSAFNMGNYFLLSWLWLDLGKSLPFVRMYDEHMEKEK